MRTYLIEERDYLWYLRLFEDDVELSVIIECKTKEYAESIANTFMNEAVESP